LNRPQPGIIACCNREPRYIALSSAATINQCTKIVPRSDFGGWMYETPVRFFFGSPSPRKYLFQIYNLSRRIYLKQFKHALEWLFDISLNY
jgi:hypothetical protein